jgi:hypothetical protein
VQGLLNAGAHASTDAGKDRCKDHGTGCCKHGRQKGQCKGCDTGAYCQHGSQKPEGPGSVQGLLNAAHVSMPARTPEGPSPPQYNI